jgi:hypothetical protein
MWGEDGSNTRLLLSCPDSMICPNLRQEVFAPERITNVSPEPEMEQQGLMK